MKLRLIWAASIACLVFASISLAATIKLKDGRVLVGEIKKLGNSYSILMPDGTRSIVPADNIVSIDGKSVGAAAPATPDAPAPAAPVAPTSSTPAPSGAAPAAGLTSGATAGGSAAFKLTKSKADKADAPIIALQLWDDFLQKNPTSPDLTAAKAEREFWNKLYKDKSEKIKGKWVGGQELKDLKKKCDDLYKEAVDPSESMGVRGVQGLKKLDDIIAIYPRHFGANYEKGLYNLKQVGANRIGSAGLLSKAISALETTTQIAPTVPEVWANLAIGYNFRGEYQKSVESAYRAVKIRGDDKELIQTLANALFNAPPNFREVNPKVREINTEARILFEKYSISPSSSWTYQRPHVSEGDSEPDDVKHQPGVQWSGSGFFVSADGYIVTNHHVAAGDAHKPVPDGISWRVRMDDGTEVPAELIGIDEKADIAVMKVKLPTPNEYLRVATDNPEQGAEALVLGYPTTGTDELTLQISKGTVKSIHEAEEYNVWFDLNTTHGNSGGPIVDRDGHVIGILTAGGKVYDMVLTMGVGPKQIETFIALLGDKAPKLQYAKPLTTGDGVPLDSQKLTRECRKSTVCVFAVRGVETSDGAKKGADTTGGTPGGGDAPATPGDGGGDAPKDGGDTGGASGGGAGHGKVGASR